MEYSIVMDNVTYTYSGGSRPAIEKINLKVEKGETLMITGPAGAGKTTLCRCLNGLIPHFFLGKLEGNVIINGADIRNSNVSALSHMVGLLFQDPASQLVCPTVIDEVAFGPENYGVPPIEIRKRVDECVRAVRLQGYEERNPHSLSGGEQQACALAAIMSMRSRIYVLDEPTSNLDPLGSYQVLNLMTELARTEKNTMVIVEHKMEELLNLVDRLIVMNEGRIVLEGKPRELLENVESMEKMGLKPPQATLLAAKLKERDVSIALPLTLEEAFKAFSEILSIKEVPTIRREKVSYERSDTKIIETQNLWHIYPGETIALRGMNLKIYEGEFIAIIGQNGSGKTTLVKHFNGLLKPTKGKVFVYGVDTTTETIAELSKKVGYCFQNPDHQICCETVRKELEFGPVNLHVAEAEIERRVIQVAKAVGLEHVLNENPFSLSKGERQRVAVASVLTMKPDVLIIDEPTTGQDYRMGKEMMEFYKNLNEKEGKTIIVITHDMNLVAEYAKRIVVLRNGEILCDGPTREVFSQSELLGTTYLRPPQVTRLGQLLSAYGIPGDVLTVDEMRSILAQLTGG